jgi:hypothetical protein
MDSCRAGALQRRPVRLCASDVQEVISDFSWTGGAWATVSNTATEKTGSSDTMRINPRVYKASSWGIQKRKTAESTWLHGSRLTKGLVG